MKDPHDQRTMEIDFENNSFALWCDGLIDEHEKRFEEEEYSTSLPTNLSLPLEE